MTIAASRSLEEFETAGMEPVGAASAQPPEQEARQLAAKELRERIDRMVVESRQQRDALKGRYWLRSLRYWAGRQWIDRRGRKRRGKNWTEAVVNEIHPVVEQKAAMLTENNPRGVFLPVDNSDVRYAQDLEAITMARVRQMQGRTHLIRAAHNLMLFGFCVTKVFWDDTLSGQADVGWYLVPPRQFIIDPLATGIDDAEYVGLERMVSLDYCKQRWEEFAEELDRQARTQDMDTALESYPDADTLEEELGHTTRRQSYDVEQHLENRTVPMVRLVEMYYRDYTTKTVEVAIPFEQLKRDKTIVQNAGGQWVYRETGRPYSVLNAPRTEVEVPAYPEGRLTIKIGEVIVEDMPWEGRWPFALGVNTPVPHRWYGLPEAETLIERQDILNDTVSKIEDHAKLALHPRRKVEMGALADPKSLRNTPDAVIKVNDGRSNGVSWEPAPEMPATAWNLVEFCRGSIENISGLPAATRGRQLPRSATATEIATLDRAGRGRVGMVSALFDEYIARLFFLTAQAIQKHYEPDRIVRVVGPEGQVTAVQMSEQIKRVKYDVTVEAGSTLPFDRQARKADALSLYNVLGVAYLPELLDAYEVKNKQEVLQRYQLWQMFQQYAPLLQDPQFQQLAAQYAAARRQQQPQQTQGQENAVRQ